MIVLQLYRTRTARVRYSVRESTIATCKYTQYSGQPKLFIFTTGAWTSSDSSWCCTSCCLTSWTRSDWQCLSRTVNT